MVAQVTSDGEADTILDPVEAVRKRLAIHGGGLESKVTGGAGYSADAIKVFEGINGTLLGAAFALVLLLLILIYRSPIFWLFPILAVAFAEVATRGIGYWLTTLGVTVNGQSSAILSILVLGAGTDYALLLVARYREELRRHTDRHEAMALALRTAGPAIFASGLTVIAALLCLTLAEVNGTVRARADRRARHRGRDGRDADAAAGAARHLRPLGLLPVHPALRPVAVERADRRLGSGSATRIAARPRKVWVGVVALLLVLSLGLLNFSTGLTTGNSFRGEVESVQGQELLSESFPSGANAPVDIIVRDLLQHRRGAHRRSRRCPASRRSSPPARRRTSSGCRPCSSPSRTRRRPTRSSRRSAPRRRARAAPETLVGGATAVEADLRDAATRDTKLIVPIALVVVFLILMVLLRAVVAPLLLIGTVILSFAAALGVGAVVFDVAFGFPGSDPSLPLFAFVFLVALGIDYNIFLMTRVREETRRYGTRAGMLRGLAVTGGVITAAGIVLAGTFLVLGVLPLIFLTEIGFVVAFGVLLDTFIVRSVLVPALVLDVGPKVWSPSSLAKGAE